MVLPVMSSTKEEREGRRAAAARKITPGWTVQALCICCYKHYAASASRSEWYARTLVSDVLTKYCALSAHWGDGAGEMPLFESVLHQYTYPIFAAFLAGDSTSTLMNDEVSDIYKSTGGQGGVEGNDSY